ncbi:hypothetical protein [Selenomonas ruminantium]|uniref:Transposase n=1 Tax=Selenomonas ruminantium TaxID=971 RepID=A0A1H0S1C7_SELRU|nr:hypothetical protein [Selenomonas ruminantium]SDP35379.1 hypothetical protein SAMN05216366_11511 [Selenomonas ruminantium]
MSGPNACAQINVWLCCQASPRGIHRLTLLFTTSSIDCGLDPTTSRLNCVTRKKKTPKEKSTGDKSPNFTPDHAATIIKYFEGHSAGGFLKTKLHIIGEIFKRVFIAGSVRRQIIDINHMLLAGDGTPVKVSNRERSHSTCDCHKNGIANCCHKRWFSQPDANWGWDSSRNFFYYSYNLYLFTDAESGLPVFPILERASRYDLPAMLHGLACIKTFFADWKISALILDAAHDASAV